MSETAETGRSEHQSIDELVDRLRRAEHAAVNELKRSRHQIVART